MFGYGTIRDAEGRPPQSSGRKVEWMEGPYRLTGDQVTSWVPLPLPGVYLLSDDGEEMLRVGRCHDHMAACLKGWVGWYRLFWFDYALSPRAAYQRECELYHQHAPRDNQSHPQAPSRTRWLCPVPQCPFGYPWDLAPTGLDGAVSKIPAFLRRPYQNGANGNGHNGNGHNPYGYVNGNGWNASRPGTFL